MVEVCHIVTSSEAAFLMMQTKCGLKKEKTVGNEVNECD